LCAADLMAGAPPNTYEAPARQEVKEFWRERSSS